MEKLRVATMRFEYFFELEKDGNNTWRATKGIEVQFLNLLSEVLNFSYELLVPADGEWGTKKDDGNWTGLIGMVSRNEADIAIDTLSVSTERKEVVDFSEPYWTDHVIFVTSAPKAKADNYPFLRPYSGEVWMLMISVFLLTLSILLLEVYFGRRRRTPWYSVTAKVSTYLYGLLLRQGLLLPSAIRRTKTRFFAHLWLVLSALMSSAYCGVLLSFLLVPVVERPPTTPEALKWAVEHNGYSCGAAKGSVIHRVLQRTDNNDILTVIGRSMTKREANSMTSTEAALKRCLTERFAYLEVKLPLLMNLYEVGVHRFNIARDPFYSTDIAIAMRKGLRMKRKINKMIKKINGAGLMIKWIRDELSELQIKSNSASSGHADARPLSLFDLSSVFLWTIYCHTFSMCLFCLEVIVGKKKSSRRSSKKLVLLKT